MASVIEESGINLFGGQPVSLENIDKLNAVVNCSELNKSSFAKDIQNNTGNALATGIGFYILGEDAQAAESLEKAADCMEKHLFLGRSLRRAGKFDEAVKSFQEAEKHNADSLMVSLEKVETLRQAGKLEDAQQAISGCGNFEKVSAEYHFQLGRLNDAEGLYAQAMKNYQIAIELDSSHQKALFHLAYACDLRAIVLGELYRHSADSP